MTDHEKIADAFREQRSRILHGLADNARPTQLIIPDLPAYESPVTGQRIEGRVARREDLKRNGCVEYDPGMKDDAIRREADREAKAESHLDRMINDMVIRYERRK